MIKKRGIALIMVLLVVLVFVIIFSSLFVTTMNENNLVQRYVNSTRALWLAEAGIARTIASMYSTGESGYLDPESKHYYSTEVNQLGTTDIFEIRSDGIVYLANPANSVTRTVVAHVKVTPVTPGDFDKALEVNGELTVTGNAEILGWDGPPPDAPPFYKEDANLLFTEKFNVDSEEVRQYAIDHDSYFVDPDPNEIVVDGGITWVDVVDAEKATISDANWTGNGLLIIRGHAEITGGTFDGIIWVMGQLRMSGNPEIQGAVFAECDADVDTKVTGTVFVQRNPDEIGKALVKLPPTVSPPLSWREE